MNRRIIILITIIIITAILILIWVLSPPLVQEHQFDIISREEINIGKRNSINILKYTGEQTLSCFLSNHQIIIYDIKGRENISKLFVEDVLLLEFTNDPQFFLGVRDKIIADDGYGNNVVYLEGIGIWNAVSGILEECLRGDCETSSPTDLIYTGATINYDINWVIIYAEFGWSTVDPFGNKPTTITTIAEDRDALVQSITMSPSSNQYVVGYTDGSLERESINFRRWSISRILYPPENQSPARIILQKFSPNEKYIVVVYDTFVSLWELDWLKRSHTLINFSSIQFAEFDKDSENLFLVSIDDELIVWNIKTGNEVSRFDVPNISAIAMSSDSDTIYWGDEAGVLHIWDYSNP